MELEGLFGALRAARVDGISIRDWSVFGSESRTVSVGIKDREVGNVHAPINLAEGLGVRYRLIWSDGKVSRGFLERRLLDTDPVAALERARETAHDDPDAAWVLGPAPMPEVRMFDAKAAAVAAGDVSPIASRLAEIRRRVDEFGAETWSGSFSAGLGESRLVTSAGLDVTSRGTTTGWHVTLNGEIGDGFSARAAENDDDFERRLERLLQTAELLRRPSGSVGGGIVPVLLHPGVVEDYVIDTIFDNLSGSAVAHGDGHFRREQFGAEAPVLREDLRLHLDPLLPLRRGTYRFTTQGVPAAPTTYIENGRLVEPVLDIKYARRLGRRPTPAPLATDTLFFEGADPLGLDDALGLADGGVLILSVLGVHTQDSASGDFSLSAPQALTIGPDGLAGRTRGTISGNLFRLLNDAQTRFVRFEGEQTPGLLVRCALDPR